MPRLLGIAAAVGLAMSCGQQGPAASAGHQGPTATASGGHHSPAASRGCAIQRHPASFDGSGASANSITVAVPVNGTRANPAQFECGIGTGETYPARKLPGAQVFTLGGEQASSPAPRTC